MEFLQIIRSLLLNMAAVVIISMRTWETSVSASLLMRSASVDVVRRI